MYVAIAVTTIPALVACFLPATHLTHLEPSTPPRYHLKKRKKWQARRRRRWRCKQKKWDRVTVRGLVQSCSFRIYTWGIPPLLTTCLFLLCSNFSSCFFLSFFFFCVFPSFLPSLFWFYVVYFLSFTTYDFSTSQSLNNNNQSTAKYDGRFNDLPSDKKKSITNNISRLDRDVGWGQKKFLIRSFLLSFEVKWLFSCGQWLIMRTQVH